MAGAHSDVTTQRCFNHVSREAAARCPECRHYFCRECVTEHDDRVVCTTCLRRLVQPKRSTSRQFAAVSYALQCALGVLLAWFFFFMIGETLLRLPASFHSGDLWQAGWFDGE
jgi:hypothetical protein